MSFAGDTGGNGTAFAALTWVSTGNPGATGSYYLLPVEGAPDTAEYFVLVAGPGTYVTLKALFSIALTTDSVTFTVRKNGVDTALAATIAPGALSAVVSGSLAVVAGDRISIKVVQTGTEATTTRVAVGLY